MKLLALEAVHEIARYTTLRILRTDFSEEEAEEIWGDDGYASAWGGLANDDLGYMPEDKSVRMAPVWDGFYF